ncbi:MAG TPA: methylmalonate-semialdehyde dehydrogenase (CoA acylating) [Acidimicrobiaceae bacterium]|nr:CoA-acylating methylmalonate-semialdehyde dehydrogenase [Actinomycetota bacterium]MDG2120528.1 CoA-acylating methylmalonate-semialdehyde dehydrogenase [Actinomycetota bacterium]NCG41235.1 CoA-acylating methylmalonate-semialdehyde dehydrogenase [Actinomycetota bacterium]HAN07240.1 methylmalonate-semialdehyde dehydrogenase (CoA acylating) [Acidimicrobiaceae bacterium]
MRKIHHFIGGQKQIGTSGRVHNVFDPSSGLVQAEVDLASLDDVNDVVTVAQEAALLWKESSLTQRTQIMFAFREILSARANELAKIISSEHGKVISDAFGEVARGIENVEFACGIGQHLKGEINEQVSVGIEVYSLRQPLGVVAGITPFNFPAMVPCWMFATAIASGNTFICKPSERDPSASMLIAEWFKEAGLPDGVFNVLNGDKVAVDGLIDHPGISAISFVGSTPIARYVYERGTQAGKRVQALGGAKNHMLVLPDADIEMAADAAVSAAYGSAGERCMAISAVVAVGTAADEIVEAIASRIPNVKIGPGDAPDSEMGPLITAEHKEKVAAYVTRARDAGAVVVEDGADQDLPKDGFFYGPTLLDRVTQDMECYRDEIFGPVLSVVRVTTFEEAITLINSNPYGNGTAIFTRDGGAARKFQHEVEVGMVGINVPIPVPVAYHSFGGWKASLFGDAHMYGPDGVRFFTRAKVVTARWPDPGTSSVDLGFPRN